MSSFSSMITATIVAVVFTGALNLFVEELLSQKLDNSYAIVQLPTIAAYFVFLAVFFGTWLLVYHLLHH